MKTSIAPSKQQLVELHYAAVWSLARKLTGDDATASDVTQETFARALARIDDVHSPRSWLFKIATNHVRDLHRRRGRDWGALPEATSPPSDAILERTEELARVRRALDVS